MKNAKVWWVWLVDEMRMADVVRPALENLLFVKSCEQPTCTNCATRYLSALHFDWKNVIGLMKTSVETLVTVLAFLSDHPDVYLPVFHITPAAFVKILDGIAGGNSERLELTKKDDSSDGKEVPLLVFKYGRTNGLATDLVLVVQNTEFHFLSIHSPVFAAMFFSEFEEKSEEKVTIKDDETAFKGMLDLLYEGQIDDEMDFLTCNKEESQDHIIQFWKRLPSIMSLFDYYDIPYRLIEDLLLGRCSGNADCLECANKKLFSLHYNLQKVKAKIPTDIEAIVGCLRKFHDVLPVPLHLTPEEFCGILKATKEKYSAE